MTIEKKLSSEQMVQQALQEVTTISVDEALQKHQSGAATFIDLRDIRELKREGKVPGSIHIPRGMLEFWLDPESPYAKEIFQQEGEFVFYCNKGWRSALATQAAQNMGLQSLCHIDGGFTAWKAASAPVETDV